MRREPPFSPSLVMETDVSRNLYLLPYQEDGAHWLATNKRAMLAWDMGTGKTPTAVKACDVLSASRVLVICPPIVTRVWSTHFREWSDQPYDIRVLAPADAVTPFTFMEGVGIVRIVPYSYLGREHHEHLINALKKFSDQWDVIILDECHNLKNPEAKRTQTVYGRGFNLLKSVCEDATHIWALSGTPMLNNAGELWTHFHALRPDLITFNGKVLDETFFYDRYCVSTLTKYGTRHVVGTRNAAELADKARRFMHRRRLKDVLPELPELRITEYELPEDTPISVELREKIEEITDAIELECCDDDELLAAVQSGSVFFSTARRLIGLAKAPGVAELASNDLEAGPGKLIVFAHHRDVIAELAKQLLKYNPLIIHGGMSKTEATKRVETFQTDAAYRLLIMAIDIAEGIGLFAAHNVLLAEPSPVPARNAQAIARAHRKGQKNPVLARFVLLPGTIDQRLMSIVARKTRDILRVIDPDLVKNEPTQDELFPEKI